VPAFAAVSPRPQIIVLLIYLGVLPPVEPVNQFKSPGAGYCLGD
jgi:hypothetical protein